MTMHNDLGTTENDQQQEPEPSLDTMRGILAGYTRVGPESDAERIEWLDAQGVVSIYLRDGRQINPASMSIRAAIDAEMDSLAGAPVPAVDRSRFSPAGTPPEDTTP
jgi:hypothetical protein